MTTTGFKLPFASAITEWLNHTIGALTSDTIVYQSIVIIGLMILVCLIYMFFRFLVVGPIAKSRFASKELRLNQFLKSKVLGSMASILAIVLISIIISLLPGLTTDFHNLTHRVIDALLIFTIARMIVRISRFADDYYSSLPSVNRDKAFQGYITVGSFIIYSMAIILVLATLMGKSPAYFLTGLGAMSAVLLIVFRDTLLSMFANVIVTTGDLVRVGDWIVVNDTDANGHVIEVSLNLVKVQNWDHTITSLPTYTLVQKSFTNWRGMFDSGGRRIKRSILLDQRSIRTLTEEELDQIEKIRLMDKALALEKQAVAGNPECADGLLITNSGLFRQYCLTYILQHPKIQHDGMTLLVRQLQPTENGLPIELYCFTTETQWAIYESVQAMILDHLLALLPVFGLRVFQAQTDFSEPDTTSRKVNLEPRSLVRFESVQ
jgi:miniconductance mechanosensitive channel